MLNGQKSTYWLYLLDIFVHSLWNTAHLNPSISQYQLGQLKFIACICGSDPLHRFSAAGNVTKSKSQLRKSFISVPVVQGQGGTKAEPDRAQGTAKVKVFMAGCHSKQTWWYSKISIWELRCSVPLSSNTCISCREVWKRSSCES